jgi:hypothetical protein
MNDAPAGTPLRRSLVITIATLTIALAPPALPRSRRAPTDDARQH